jgi:hypothetical protein
MILYTQYYLLFYTTTTYKTRTAETKFAVKEDNRRPQPVAALVKQAQSNKDHHAPLVPSHTFILRNRK